MWDFAINLSGADLPLRDVDDLAMALAPHRNENFFSFHCEFDQLSTEFINLI